MKQGQKLVSSFAVLTAFTFAQAQVPQAPPFNTNPARELGQTSLTLQSLSPNLVEGREFWQPRGIALDPASGALFVSDTANNRVLVWRNAAGFTNGAFADVVIGQRNMFSTSVGGPGTSFTRGLNGPTGLAVDAQGNLYVVDAGNNRILRYETPLSANPPDPTVIGQPDFNSNQANHGASTAVPDGISTPLVYHNYGNGKNVPLTQALAFDSNGNLWFTDTGNSRVLRFPSAGAGKVSGTADVVLGQASMYSSTTLDQTQYTVTNKAGMRYPMGLGIDPSGRIFVADDINRVLVFAQNPPPVGASALRIMGIVVVPQGGTVPPVNNTGFGGPRGVFFIGNQPAVVDSGNNRILVFAPFDQWAAESANAISPAAQSVIGQPDMNTGASGMTSSSLYGPFAAAGLAGHIYVADTFNNRVVDFPVSSGTAARVLGQINFGYNAPNLIEGREFYLFNGYYTIANAYDVFTDSGGIAIDTKSDPPHLYVADTYNNRILGFRDMRGIRSGATADLVIGQADLFSSLINAPSNDPSQLNDTGLYLPAGVAVDASGNLWVADRGNGRVLRFPKPFDQPAGAQQHANLVLGQRSFTAENTDPSPTNMAAPYGLAFMPEGYLLVSDMVHNRVLLFEPTGADFTSGQAATAHFGQPDFYTTATAKGLPNRMLSPRGIASDGSGRLYVADPGNSRVLVYTNVGATGPNDDPSPALSITNANQYSTLQAPIGVAIQPGSGQIWVVEPGGQNGTARVSQFPEFSQIPPTGGAYANLTMSPINPAVDPLAMAFDGQGTMLVADSANRVEFYYPPLWTTNAANYLPLWGVAATAGQPCCAPGSMATLWPLSSTGVFGSFATAGAGSIPLSTVLSGIQVLVSGDSYPETAAPLYFMSPGQINFQVPQGVPSSGALNVNVVNQSTNQLLASGVLTVAPASPALLTNPSFPTTTKSPNNQPAIQVAALNYETDSSGNTVVSCNGVANAAPASAACPAGVKPVKRGATIVLFLTGQGLVPGMPADGAPAPSTPLWTPLRPSVYLGGSALVPDANVTYTGLAPTLIGVWQINVTVPATTPVGEVPVFVKFNDRASMVSGYPWTVIQVQ